MWWAIATALAGDVSVGIGGGVASDMADPAVDTAAGARFSLGLGVQLPVRVRVGANSRLRFDLGYQAARGEDRITFEIDDEVRFLDGQPAAMNAATAAVGGDLFFGRTPVYVGAGMGVGLFVVGHAVSGGPPELGENLASRQFAPLADAHLGAYQPVGDKVAIWLESGYSMSFLDGRALHTAGLNAQRAPFGWNAVRLSLGVSYSL
jgi:hypothetical protein